MTRAPMFLLLTLALTPAEVLACSCMGPRNALEAHSATAVFRGRVVRIEARGAGDAPYTMRHPVEIEFEVSRVWRGHVERRAVILSGLGGGDCGLEVWVGREYVVPAYEVEPGVLAAGLCSGVQTAYEARPALLVLGRGRAPVGAHAWEHILPPAASAPSRRGLAALHAVASLLVLVGVCGRLGAGRRPATSLQ